jgi:hypothetical protein
MKQTKEIGEFTKMDRDFWIILYCKISFLLHFIGFDKTVKYTRVLAPRNAILHQQEVMWRNVPQLVAGFLSRKPSSMPGQVVWDL